jgi:hypothetical protein
MSPLERLPSAKPDELVAPSDVRQVRVKRDRGTHHVGADA